MAVLLFLTPGVLWTSPAPTPKISQLLKTQWTRDQGLPSDNITSVIQDDQGYMWIGTYEGLVRFNGVDFKLISPNTTPGFPLRSARILALTPWGLAVGSNGDGLVILHGDQWTTYAGDQGLGNLNIRALAWDTQQDRLFVGTTNGVYILQNGKIVPAKIFGRENSGTVEALYTDPQGGVWVSFDIPGDTFIFRGSEPGVRLGAPWVYTSVVRAFLRDKQGAFYAGTRDQGIFLSQGGGWSSLAENKIIPELKINELLEDDTGALWVGTDSGLFKFYDQILESYSEKDGLGSGLVDTLWEDKESNIWMGSSRGGLTKLSRSKFLFFTPKQGIPDPVVNCFLLLVEQNLILIGSDKGIGALDFTGKTLEHPLVTATKNERIRHLFRDSQGRIWIGTYGDRGVLLWDGVKIKSFGKASGLSGVRIRQIFEDHQGGIWVATTSGLNRLQGDKWKIFDQKSGLENHYILGMTQDAQGLLWLGTDGGGLYSLDPKSEVLTHYGLNEGLRGLVVFKIITLPQGKLLAATNGGLGVYQGGQWTHFRQGLPFDSYFQIIPSKGGYWLTATQGLVWISDSWFQNPQDYKLFSRADGLFADISPASWGQSDSQGRLWLPTLGGAAFFDASDNLTNEVVPPLVLEEVRSDGVLQDRKLPLVLKAGTQRLTINYAGLSYQYPSQVRYKTKLEGFDLDWSTPTASRSLSYTNLPPGSYVFKLLAANNDGLWTPQPLELSFRQEAPFYLNWWFILLEILVVIIGVFTTIRLWSWRSLVYRKELEAQVVSRTQELHKEKEKSELLLLSILPPSIAQRLKTGERVIADSIQDATILFSDIIEFTPLASTMPASQLVELLNGIFSEFDTLCDNLGVEKIKTTGDAYMAACGVPQPVADHGLRVCRLARGMIDTLQSYNLKHGTDLHMRIGIHSGPVTAGVIGRNKFIYDLWGDTVNVASRLEHSAPKDNIQISGQVEKSVREFFHAAGPMETQLKGKGEVITWYLGEPKEVV